jgi:hypothetical protein
MLQILQPCPQAFPELVPARVGHIVTACLPLQIGFKVTSKEGLPPDTTYWQVVRKALPWLWPYIIYYLAVRCWPHGVVDHPGRAGLLQHAVQPAVHLCSWLGRADSSVPVATSGHPTASGRD